MTLIEILERAAPAITVAGVALVAIGRHLKRLRDDLAALSNQVSAEGSGLFAHTDQLHQKLDTAIRRLPKTRAKRSGGAS